MSAFFSSRGEKITQRLETIAEAMEKYIKTADKIEYVQADVEMLKRVTADHHEQLKKLNKSKQ